MSDDRWKDESERRRAAGRYESEMDSFEDDEFGGPLFGETTEQPAVTLDEEIQGERLSFGNDDSGALPHWTDPPTGEVPSIGRAELPERDPTDDLDVWSSFASATDDESAAIEPPKDPTGELSWHDDPAPADPTGAAGPESGSTAAVAAGAATAEPARREPARITIGTDPSGMPRRPDPRGRGGVPQRPPGAARTAPQADGRNMPIAVATGVALAVVFLALTLWRPAGALVFVTIALGLAAIEYFTRVTDKGYRPAIAVGVAACAAAPLAAYWAGDAAIPLVVALAFAAGAMGFVGADSIESGPMPNMAITMLGVVWIGVMGAYAALILSYSNLLGGTNWGTDTLVLVAIGVVANDVGAFFLGSAIGKTPLRPWISPNKSLEGLLGGTVLTLIVMLVVGIQDFSDTWSSTSHLLMLGIVISFFAPLGDLTESMFKRNLDVKDFGTLIRGHGGVLDRFDGFLFVLPAVYYLMRVVEPWLAL